MGWGLKVDNVFLSRISKLKMKEILSDNERILKYYRDKLLQLATATPRDVDGEYTWEDHVLTEVNETVKEIIEMAGINFILFQAIENPDTAKDS